MGSSGICLRDPEEFRMISWKWDTENLMWAVLTGIRLKCDGIVYEFDAVSHSVYGG